MYAVSLFAQLVYRLVNGPLALRMPRRLLLLRAWTTIYFVAGSVRPRVRHPDFITLLTFRRYSLKHLRPFAKKFVVKILLRRALHGLQ